MKSTSTAKKPAAVKQVTSSVRDLRGFVSSPSGGRVRRIPPVD